MACRYSSSRISLVSLHQTTHHSDFKHVQYKLCSKPKLRQYFHLNRARCIHTLLLCGPFAIPAPMLHVIRLPQHGRRAKHFPTWYWLDIVLVPETTGWLTEASPLWEHQLTQIGKNTEPPIANCPDRQLIFAFLPWKYTEEILSSDLQERLSSHRSLGRHIPVLGIGLPLFHLQGKYPKWLPAQGQVALDKMKQTSRHLFPKHALCKPPAAPHL